MHHNKRVKIVREHFIGTKSFISYILTLFITGSLQKKIISVNEQTCLFDLLLLWKSSEKPFLEESYEKKSQRKKLPKSVVAFFISTRANFSSSRYYKKNPCPCGIIHSRGLFPKAYLFILSLSDGIKSFDPKLSFAIASTMVTKLVLLDK